MEKKLPNSSKVVVIGGGVVGCSVAYHLAKFGWKDTILLETWKPIKPEAPVMNIFVFIFI